jgi:hypothetical protein
MRKSTPRAPIARRENLRLYRVDFPQPAAIWADIALNTEAMKHPALTLFVLVVVLVPWLAAVALGDWIRAQLPGPQDALKH